MGTLREDLSTFVISCGFLECEMFQMKLVGRIKTHFVLNSSFQKSCCLWGNMEKCGRTGQTTDDKMQCIGFAFWIIEATHTHTHTQYLLPFHGNVYANASQYYVIRTLSLFFFYASACDFNFMITRRKNPIFSDVAWNIFWFLVW
jgi:hypothetical protein